MVLTFESTREKPSVTIHIKAIEITFEPQHPLK